MKKTLPLFHANLLYALSMLVVITLGALVQRADLSWGLIATEVLLIALPTLLFLRWQRVPVRSGLRLNPISPLTAVLCVILGVAMFFFGLVIEAIMAQLTGLKSVDIPTGLLPKTTFDMVVFFIGMAVAAPICEEMLFRGAIQGAYESRKSARFAITITALMFAFYHFRLSGLPALLPIAFVLCYVTWRTGSIYAAILVHFGNNGISALQSVTYFQTDKGLPFLGPGAALIGLVVAILILLVIRRLHPRLAAQPVPDAAPATAGSRPWLATYWPLLLAGLLYTGVATVEAMAALTPRVAPASALEYGRPTLSSPVVTRYEIAHRGGEPVGEMVCTLQPASAEVRLECARVIRAYEYRSGLSMFVDGDHRDAIRVTWDASTMRLRDFLQEKTYKSGSEESTVRDGVLTTATSQGGESVPLDDETLVEFEWAWRVALLKANSGDAFSVPFATLIRWNEKLGKSAPLVEDQVLQVGDEEQLALPQGMIRARKLIYGPRAAWYARDDATTGVPRPAKFDDGMLIYTMLR